MPDEGAVRDDPEAGRFEVTVDGKTAWLEYARGPHRLVLLHTEVPPALEGRGLAGRLARHAFERARQEGLEVVPECPFQRSWLERHPEYHDLLWREAGPAAADPPWME